MGTIFSEDKTPPGTLSEKETARIIAERRGEDPPSDKGRKGGLFGSWKLALAIVAILLAYNGYTIWKGKQAEKQQNPGQAVQETQIEAQIHSDKPLPYYYTVDELVEDYAQEPQVSTAKYTGRYIKVTGDVEDFGVTDEGLRYLVMNSDNRPGDMSCVFNKEHEPFLNTLERGDYVKVVGRSQGIKSSRLLFTECKNIE